MKNEIHHQVRGADLFGTCGQSVAAPGHFGAFDPQYAYLTGGTACGACHLLETEKRRPRHMAHRQSPQAIEGNGLRRLAEAVGLAPYAGKHAVQEVAA